MQRYKNVQASFYSEFFTSRYPYVKCKYHIVWTIDICSFRRTPRYCTWYLYHFRTLNKWNWQKNMDHLIHQILIGEKYPYSLSVHMHNFVDLFYAYCMPLKSISTRKPCLLSSLPRPPPSPCLPTLNFPTLYNCISLLMKIQHCCQDPARISAQLIQ
jgi:hypothetical protein